MPWYVSLADVIEGRRWARPHHWVSYASGDPLDSKHPVVALVRGWQRLGLVELCSDTMPTGWLRHSFRRTKADFPSGWFDLPRWPPQPPAKRDPLALHGGVGSMAQWAVDGDEEPEWVRFAALALADELCGPQKASDDAVFRASVVLRAVATLLDPEGDSARFAKIRWRRPGRQATGQRVDRSLKEHAAAGMVEARLAAQEKKDAALRAVSSNTKISEGRIKTRLAQYRRVKNWEADNAAAEAARLVHAITLGGLTQEAALSEVAAATGLVPAVVRKSLARLKKS